MCIQPWDALEAWLTQEEFLGYLRGTAIAYLARAGRKGDAREDVAKAVHTLERLLETIDDRDEKGGTTCNDSKT